tara:strand:+ start:1918 stop:2172 length:255 start_codon:yes stop_codon:yes gene_type:complete
MEHFTSCYYQPQEDQRVFWNIDKQPNSKFEQLWLHLEFFSDFSKTWRRIDSKELPPTTRLLDMKSEMQNYYYQSMVDGIFEEHI